LFLGCTNYLWYEGTNNHHFNISTLFGSVWVDKDYGKVDWEEWDTCLILIVEGDKRRDIVVWDIILK
jgi:hypothetical protein